MQHMSACSAVLLCALASCATTGTVPSGAASSDATHYEGPSLTASPRTETALAAQNNNRRHPGPGNLEVQLGAAGGNDEDFETGGGNLNASVGYYFGDVVELIVRQSLGISDSGPGPDTWNGMSRVGLDFNAQLDPVILYAGGLFGRIYGDTVADSWTAGPEIGLKWYIKDEAFLNVGAEYQFFFDEDDRVGDAFENGSFVYVIGFGLLF